MIKLIYFLTYFCSFWDTIIYFRLKQYPHQVCGNATEMPSKCSGSKQDIKYLNLETVRIFKFKNINSKIYIYIFFFCLKKIVSGISIMLLDHCHGKLENLE